MHVRKLDPDHRADVRQFVQFPFDLYRDCDLWVPPLISSAQAIMNRRRHPFYEHSLADFFVVECTAGETLGRLALLENRNYNRYRGTKTAFFGYFEVVEDMAAAQALLNAGLDWARARGLTEVIGPRGVLGVDGSVLVEGFEHRPALGIPYNFPYYDAFIRAAGFEKDTDYLSGYRAVKPNLKPRFYHVAEQVRQRRGFWVKSFASLAEIRRWLPRLLAVHHHDFSQLHSYYPATAAETKLVIDTLLTIGDPRLIKLVMKEKAIVGFALAWPDISAALQQTRGRLWPWGWYHLWREKKRTTWLNVSAIGLLPAYRGVGANAVLYTALEAALQGTQFEHVEMVQIDERNTKSLSDLENLGGRWYKRHRHYRRDLSL